MIPNFPSVLLLYTLQKLMAFGRKAVFLFPLLPNSAQVSRCSPQPYFSLTIPRNFKTDTLMESDWRELVTLQPSLTATVKMPTRRHLKCLNGCSAIVFRSSQVGHERVRDGGVSGSLGGSVCTSV